MILGTLLHNQYNFNLYQSRSNEFKIGATLWKNIMYEREHRRCKARVGGFGGMPPPRENFEKWVQFDDYWHISCSLFLVQKAPFTTDKVIFFLKKDELINFYVISSTFRLVHDYMWCTIGKAIL